MAQNSIYDDQDTDQIRDLEKSFGSPDATESGSQKLAEKQNLEDAYNAPDATESGSKKLDDAKKLKDDEEQAPDRSGFSAGDDMREKLGLGYTGKGSTKSKGLSKLYSSNSGLKKKVAIAGAAAGGGILVAVITFLALLPLKIEHMITNLENHYSSAANQALGKETEKLFSNYVKRSIIPSLETGTCRSTIDPKCVVVANGTGPVGKLYAAWSKGRLENELATKYGLVFTKQGSNFYMNTNGRSVDISAYRAGGSLASANIFDLEETQLSSRSEIRRAMNTALREGTLWDNTYKRYKINKYLQSQFGIKLCSTKITCKVADKTEKITDSLNDKKLAAKATIIERVITPASANYGLVFQCLIAGAQTCKTSLDPAQTGDTNRQTPLQKQITAQLATFKAKYGEDALKDLVQKSEDISKDGFQKVMARELTQKMVNAFAPGAATAAGETAAKAIPVVGWVLLAAKLTSTAKDIGPMVRAVSYAAGAASAVGILSTYTTVASETKSGNVDPAVLGSFNDALNTNLSGSTENSQSDATASPLYRDIMGSTTSTSLTAFLDNNVYADAVSTSYTCDDGNPVPSDLEVCPEEKLDKGNSVANGISDTASVPVLSQLGSIGGLITQVAEGALNIVTKPFTAFCTANPVCSGALASMQEQLEPFMNWVSDKLAPNPYTVDKLSGARMFNGMAAGADVIGNSTCQTLLGCGKISDTQVAAIRNDQLANEKEQFQAKPLFARMFDTTNAYSLTSRLAMNMPTTLTTTTNDGFATVVNSPLASIATLFSSLFSTNRSFAATSTQGDPFGVVQYGYSEADIPDDPEAFWAQNCVVGPLASYNESTDQLDISQWLNAPGVQTLDENTGQAVNTATNPCMLIQSAVQSAGGMFDSSLLPKETSPTATTTPNQTSPGATTIPTGSAQDLAKRIMDNPNVTFQTGNGRAAFQQIVDTGRQTGCGGVAIDTRLLGVLLAASQNYKIVIGVLVNGHGCNQFYHPKGMAVDLNGVARLDGSASTGNNIRWTAAEMPIISEFYVYLSNLLSQNGGGELGQITCFPGAAPHPPTGVKYFTDTCNHLHMDVGN